MWSLTPKNIDAVLETPEQFEERKLKQQKEREKEKEKELEKVKWEKENKPTVFGQPVGN